MNYYNLLSQLKEINLSKTGTFSFRLGIFLLPSAFFLSAIFLLISILISFILEPKRFLEDKYNYLFCLSAIFMCIATTVHNFDFPAGKLFMIQYAPHLEKKEILWEASQSWIGLGNWIPFFICFWGFQKYLSSAKEREICSKLFIAGSIPVLITSFGQYWFNWHGPMSFLNNLIIWFQRPLEIDQGASGLFNNQNYNGCWLGIIWPFSLALLFEKTTNLFKKSFIVAFALSITIAIFITASRSAWGGFILTISILLGRDILLFLILFLLMLIFIPTAFQILFPENINSILPDNLNLLKQLEPQSYAEPYRRIFIFKFLLNMTLIRPFIGWGAAAFSLYYYAANKIYISHPHNLFLEIAFSYGIFASLTIFINIFFLCLFSYKNIFLQNKSSINLNYFERSWWISFFVLLCTQMVDLQYFDGRISMAFWILLAGLREIIKEQSKNELYFNK